MTFWNRNKESETLEENFDETMAWVKHLSKNDYKRFKKAMDLSYDSYQEVQRLKNDGLDEIEAIEQALEKENG